MPSRSTSSTASGEDWSSPNEGSSQGSYAMGDKWYEVTFRFPASSMNDAIDMMEEAYQKFCGGEGDGPSHVCKRPVVASGPGLVPDDESLDEGYDPRDDSSPGVW